MFRRMMPALAGWLALVGSGSAGAATLLETSELLAATSEAAAQMPPAYEFTLTAAGDYTVTLEDISSNLGTQARLESLEVLVIRELADGDEVRDGISGAARRQAFARDA